MSSSQVHTADFLDPPLCANVGASCQNAAEQACSSCKLVQYCSKKCQIANWSNHKKICKSDLTQSTYIPGWVKQGRLPSFVSDELPSAFGGGQYLWGNMPAIDILNMRQNEGINNIHSDINLLFAASGDLRNVVKTITDGLLDGYDGKCTVVMNDRNFMVVARNAILLLLALSLEVDEAVPIMIHLWYSSLLPDVMMDTLWKTVLGPIVDVCEKVKNKPMDSLQGKTFSFGTSSLRLVLKKRHWDEMEDYFSVPRGLTLEDAQIIRRGCMLAPERIDYLHRALCNQPPQIRAATIKFREDGILLPYGSSRKKFTVPNPTFFHTNLVWPMLDDAGPFEGWEFHEVQRFTPKATNDLMGSLFFFLKDMLSRFCTRIRNFNIHFSLFNVDAQELPDYLTREQSEFNRIEVSNICDRGYIGPENVLSTFGPLLTSKSINPNATLIMLFLNAVSEVYHNKGLGKQRFEEALPLLKNFVPFTPMTILTMMVDGANRMSSPEMIRISSCYTMFGNFDKVVDMFLNDVQMNTIMKKHGVTVKKKHTIVDPWPLRVTEKTTKEEFKIRCASTHMGSERYMEFGRL